VKILFDCRYTRLGRHDGISRFTAELVTALAAIHPVTMMISDQRQLAMLPDLPWVTGPSPTSFAEPLASLRVNRFHPDVVYTPMQTMGPWGRRFRLVTTVHDLIYYTNRTPPRNLPVAVRLVWRLYHLSWVPQRLLLRSADAHAAVSETTRQLMLTHHLTPHPIVIVSDAVDDPDSVREAPPLLEEGTPRDLLYMGSFMPYKNVELVARALHLLPGYRLLLLSRATDDDKARLIRLAPPGSIRFADGVSDEEYQRLLGTAFALVSASRDEGFGMPLLESMVVGTPIVVSDIPIFHEIGEDAAVFFDQERPESFAAAVRSIEDPGEWMRRSRRAVAVAAGYRWSKSARTLLDLLERVHAGR
jgi:glycosyltransferase involved in cell wall biosynthesis